MSALIAVNKPLPGYGFGNSPIISAVSAEVNVAIGVVSLAYLKNFTVLPRLPDGQKKPTYFTGSGNVTV